jgi:hypothetical protein
VVPRRTLAAVDLAEKRYARSGGALAGSGEVLVSSRVKDLAGSGIEFADRGAQVFKSVPGEWRLFAVRS